MRSRLAGCAAFVALTLLGGLPPALAEAADVVILVNGSFNTTPPWVLPGSPEFTAIADTYGVQPSHFPWSDNDEVTVFSGYSGIWNGGMLLANAIDGLGLASSDHLHLVAHSRGGNVALVASYYTRPYRHLINLGTPVNFDLPALAPNGTYSHCQVSSYADWTQFFGASPGQVTLYFEAEYWAGVYAMWAYDAMREGHWDQWYYEAMASYYQSLAEWAFLSTKIERGAVNVLFGGLSHSDLHEPPAWHAIAGCAVN